MLRPLKKICVLAAFMALASEGVFAQEKTASVKKHWLSAEAGLLGVGMRYEFMQSEQASISINMYTEPRLVEAQLAGYPQEIDQRSGVYTTGRFYPWGKTFYAGLGFGLSMHIIRRSERRYEIPGIDIVPEIGWKIDVGKPGGFFLNPYLQIPVVLLESRDACIFYRLAVGLGWAF